MTTPADIANQALDAIGRGGDIVIGNLQDGTREAKVILRAYSQCLRQLLRSANWDFARKQAPLVLLADATGQTQNVGTIVSAQNWIYEYAYPIDCMKVRFIPFNGLLTPAIPAVNIQLPQPNQISSTLTLVGQSMYPSSFLVGTDYNYPPDPAQMYDEIQGVSQQGRTVIFTNVKEAHVVYTAFMSAPSVWDSLFRAAFVTYLASEIAISLTVDGTGKTDLKVGMAIADRLIPKVKEKILQARIADGNEGLSSTDHLPDFMRMRNTGNGMAGAWAGNDGILSGGGWPNGGYGFGGWDSCCFADGSVY